MLTSQVRGRSTRIPAEDRAGSVAGTLDNPGGRIAAGTCQAVPDETNGAERLAWYVRRPAGGGTQ
jgi:hypothetical protein